MIKGNWKNGSRKFKTVFLLRDIFLNNVLFKEKMKTKNKLKNKTVASTKFNLAVNTFHAVLRGIKLNCTLQM